MKGGERIKLNMINLINQQNLKMTMPKVKNNQHKT
jgi:hypothetical protein